jgi:hypothetical protein
MKRRRVAIWQVDLAGDRSKSSKVYKAGKREELECDASADLEGQRAG